MDSGMPYTKSDTFASFWEYLNKMNICIVKNGKNYTLLRNQKTVTVVGSLLEQKIFNKRFYNCIKMIKYSQPSSRIVRTVI